MSSVFLFFRFSAFWQGYCTDIRLGKRAQRSCQLPAHSVSAIYLYRYSGVTRPPVSPSGGYSGEAQFKVPPTRKNRGRLYSVNICMYNPPLLYGASAGARATPLIFSIVETTTPKKKPLDTPSLYPYITYHTKGACARPY